MVRDYAVINIVAHPHPEGIYRKIFESAAKSNKGVRYFSNRFARLGPVSGVKSGIFSGRLYTWLELDTDANVIRKTELEESPFVESGVEIPDDIGLESRIFYYGFNIERHQLFVEAKNDDGQTISPNQAARAFSSVLSAVADEFVSELNVQTMPSSDSVERVLGLKAIKKIEMRLERPNPDDHSEKKRKILEKLDQMNAKQQEITLSKARGRETLKLDPDYRLLADVAAENGWLVAKGQNLDGKKQELSTRDYPRVVSHDLEAGSSSLAAVRSVARQNG